ncbi:hypothetical protein V6N13_054972 [Hibiscus sabdariffa]|uniref:TFIIS central domain-containing protein n=1 Tax=Hibiscus sabdariffa TaxID=183260 RepID=A0ABR2DW66_9ROSI
MQKSTPKLTSLVKCMILVKALFTVLSKTDEDTMDQVNACDPIRVAVTIESLMFERIDKSTGTHKFKYRSIMSNMKDPENLNLRKVLLGGVNSKRLITMIPEEMARTDQFDCERDAAPINLNVAVVVNGRLLTIKCSQGVQMNICITIGNSVSRESGFMSFML